MVGIDVTLGNNSMDNAQDVMGPAVHSPIERSTGSLEFAGIQSSTSLFLSLS